MGISRKGASQLQLNIILFCPGPQSRAFGTSPHLVREKELQISEQRKAILSLAQEKGVKVG